MSADLVMRDEVAVVTMTGPRGNPLNEETCAALIAAIADAIGRECRGLVLAGGDGIFSAGGDLAMLRAWQDLPPSRRVRGVMEGPQALSRALLASPVPTVAAVDGAAAGAGMDLALVCDLRVATPRARFIAAYANVGLVPGNGGGWLLPRFVGLGRAMELLTTARPVPADEALALGLVTRVVEGSVVDAAVDLARSVADSPVAAIRGVTYEGAGQAYHEHLGTAARWLGIVSSDDLHREKVRRLLGDDA